MRPGTKSGSSDKGQAYKDQVKPDLLDFLFTLSLTIGIAPEIVGRSGLLSINWIIGVPTLAVFNDIMTFLFAVSTLLFSWYGFNASISNNPVLYGSITGLLRFSLDAFLVVVYGFMLIVYDQLELVSVLIVLIFILYTVWDLLKLMEYRREPFDDVPVRDQNGCLLCKIFSKLRERRSIVYLFFILLVAGFEFLFPAELLGLWKDTIVILSFLAISLAYRADKVKLRLYGDPEKIAKVEREEQPKYAS